VNQQVGLREEEARARLHQEGPNELPAQKKRNLLTLVLEVVREPMFLMLVAGGGVYLLMGEPTDAVMLLGFVLVVMTLTIVQERRTEDALDALRDLSSPRALVIRDGQRRRIAGREVVRGDLVVLAEGDRIPADGLLRSGLHLSADESLLTGEAVPVRKAPSLDAQALDRPGGDDLASVFSGRTTVTDVCDAHPYLLRAAKFHGEPTDERCPICRKTKLTHVTYVYGDELGQYEGRVKKTRELAEMAAEYGEFRVYVVEVCQSCGWNHLASSYVLGTGEPAVRRRRRARSSQ